VLIGNVISTDNQARTNGQFMVFGENRRGGSLYLYNNTFIHQYPSGSSFVHLWYPGTTSVGSTKFEAWNNVFYVAPGAGVQHLLDADKPTPASGENNWVSTGVQSVPLTLSGTLTGEDPGLVDIGSGDYRPAVGSPLIDAGTDGAGQLPQFHYDHPRLQAPRPLVGSSIDIGAYERLTSAEAFDFNRDSKLDMQDVVALLVSMLKGDTGMSADVNGDSRVSVSDAMALIMFLRQS